MPCRAVRCRAPGAATEPLSAASLSDQEEQCDAVTPLHPRSHLPWDDSPSALLQKSTQKKSTLFLFKLISLSSSLRFSQHCLIAACKHP